MLQRAAAPRAARAPRARTHAAPAPHGRYDDQAQGGHQVQAAHVELDRVEA